MKKQLTIILLLFFYSFSFAQDWNQILKVAAIDKTTKTTAARNSNDYFGKSIDIDGDYAVVGAYNETEDALGVNTISGAGSVTIYKNINNYWTPIKKLTANIRTANDYFGYSVSISGNNVLVGAYLQDFNSTNTANLPDAGAAYIFNKDAGGTDNWGLVKKIVSNDRATLDYFGYSVDIHENTIIIGAYGDDHDAAGINTLALSGSAYIFEKDNGGVDNWGQTKKIVSNDRAIQDEFGRRVSINGEIAVVGSLTSDTDAIGMNSISNAGAAYIFKKDQGGLNTWGQLKKITASNRTTNAWFGLSVSVSGDYIAVGSNHLGAYIFSKNQGGAEVWGLVKNVLGTSVANTGFGFTTAIHNDKLVVGNATNKAFVFGRDLGGINNWGQQKEITISNPFSGASNTIENGVPVAINGSNLFVANDNEDIIETTVNSTDNAGAVYVFNKDIGGVDNWGQAQKILFIDFDNYTNNYFGGSVAIDGDFAVVGTRKNDDLSSIGSRPSGVFLFKNLNGKWTLFKKITTLDILSTDAFGYNVAIDNENIAVSAIFHDPIAPNGSIASNAGAVFIFSKNQGGADNWGQVKKIVASDRESGAIFGGSIALNGSLLVVGAPFENKDANGLNPITAAGAAYIFDKDEGGLNNWGQVKKIVPITRVIGTSVGLQDVGDRFGNSVSIDNNIIAVTAHYNDSDENELSPTTNTGSTYIFYKDQGGTNNWGQIKKIIASDRQLGSFAFGDAVSISGNILVVASPYGNLDENGINQLNQAGAAYIFYKDQGGVDNWGLIKKVVAHDRVAGNHFSGHDIVIKNSTLVIGSDLDNLDTNGLNSKNDAGSVYIYDKDNGGVNNWGLTQKIVASDRAPLDYFGVNIAFDGNTILVGAPHSDTDAHGTLINSDAGSAYFINKCTSTSIANSESSTIKEQTLATTSYFNANCETIARIQSGGTYNIAGQVGVKVWLETIQPPTFVKRHFEITPLLNPTTASGKITLYYSNQDFIDFNNANTIKLPESQLSSTENTIRKANIIIEKHSGISYDGSGKINTYLGSVQVINPIDSDIIWNNTENRWEVSFEVTGFSGFFLSSNSAAPLPIRLVSFNGKSTEKGNELTWKTSSEQNSSHYEIERSGDAKSFEMIGKVAGARNTKEKLSYSYLDNQILYSQQNSNPNQVSSPSGGGGGYYYRLRLVDLDGKFEYSKTIALEAKNKFSVSVYPNPANEFIFIENKANNQLKIRLLDALGREAIGLIESKESLIKIPTKGTVSGIYFMQINFEGGTQYKKIALLK